MQEATKQGKRVYVVNDGVGRSKQFVLAFESLHSKLPVYSYKADDGCKTYDIREQVSHSMTLFLRHHLTPCDLS